MAASPNTVTSADVQNFIIGGGGVDVGPLADVGATASVAPTVGEECVTFGVICIVRFGDATIFDGYDAFTGTAATGNFAAGLTLTTDVIPLSDADTLSAYVCTVDGSNQYATVEPWDGTLTREDAEFEGNPAYRWTFTMPELQEGEMLILYPHLAS